MPSESPSPASATSFGQTSNATSLFGSSTTIFSTSPSPVPAAPPSGAASNATPNTGGLFGSAVAVPSASPAGSSFASASNNATEGSAFSFGASTGLFSSNASQQPGAFGAFGSASRATPLSNAFSSAAPPGGFDHTREGPWTRRPFSEPAFTPQPLPVWKRHDQPGLWTGTPAFCPALEGISLPGATWHRLAAVPSFTICYKCHQTLTRTGLFPVKLASVFELISSLDTHALAHAVCYFSAPHARQLWSDAVRLGNADGFFAYARMRTLLPVCAGGKGQRLAPSTSWYKLAPSSTLQIKDFAVCATCFHDEIAGTPAEAYFMPAGTVGLFGACSCDLAVLRVRGLMRQFVAGSIQWAAFANGAQQRLHEYPACPGVGVSVFAHDRTYTWFRWKLPGDMIMCAACVLDCVLPAHAEGRSDIREDMFERYVPPGGLFGSGSPVSCAAAKPSLRFALTQDYRHPAAFNAAAVWQEAARRVLTPADTCVAHARNVLPDGAPAYRLRPSLQGEPDFDLCAGCYAGIACPLGFTGEFVLTAARDRVCDLGHARPDREEVLRALLSASAMRNFGVFMRWARGSWRHTGVGATGSTLFP